MRETETRLRCKGCGRLITDADRTYPKFGGMWTMHKTMLPGPRGNLGGGMVVDCGPIEPEEYGIQEQFVDWAIENGRRK